jgi:AraC family transcriptional regulator
MKERPDQGREAQQDALLVSHVLAEGEGWRVSDVVCHSGPEHAPFEEQHERFSIAAVIEGSFQYRSSNGRALLYPGALLLGNAGTCFACGHAHGSGDRCIAFHFAPAFFEEISATAAGSARFRFTVSMLPARRDIVASALLAACDGDTRQRAA